MEYQVEVLREPPREAAVHRFEADLAHLDEQMGPAFETVSSFLASHEVPITGPALGIYDVRRDGMGAAVGFEVEGPFEGGPGVESFVIPASETVSTIHVGPYTHLSGAYGALREYAARLGRRLDEHRMWEEYLAGPEVPSDEVRTRVVWPLVPA